MVRLPFRPRNPPPPPSLDPNAEQDASLFNNLIFHWIGPLIRRGCAQPLQQQDLPPLIHHDQSHYLGPIFRNTYHSIASADILRTATPQSSPSPQPPSQACNNTTTKSRLLHSSSSFLHRIALAFPERLAARTSRALLPVTGMPFLYAAAWKPIYMAAAIGQVFSIRAIVTYVTSSASSSTSERCLHLLVVLAMTVCAIVMSLSQHATFSGSMRAGMRARAAICSEIYAKILRLDPSSIPRVTEGELGNLLVNDTQRILDSYSYFHFCWIGFIEIIVISGLLFIDLGVFALFGVAVLALLVPAQIFFSIKVSHARSRVTIQSDVRVQKMSEILSGIRTVKLSAWEPYFMDVVATLRGNEVRHLRVAAVLRALNAALFLAAPVLVSFATFTAYTLIGKNTLTPAVVFSSIAFFSVLSRVLTFMPLGWLATSEAGVACRRLDRFFNLRELSSIPHDERMDVQHISPTDLGGFEDYSDCDNGSEEESVTDGGHGFSRVALRGVQLSYTPKQSMSDDPNFTAVLTDVSMDVKDGELVSVIGPVGSGKSTLLLGILGEVLCTRGSFQKHGSIAYCAQQPWIVNGTVRENITMFGGSDSQFCSEWYDAVIDKCCLKPDLQIFAAGDMSEIGERGINLSGGQKARIALARAVYSRADIYLLDDPLSAVDSAVSARLLRGVFGPEGLLCDKAQIIVTHQLHILPLSTRIVVLNGGTIEHNGTFEELRNHGVEFSGFSGVEDDLDRERSFAALERDCGEEIDDSETEGEELNRILKDVNIHLARQSKAEKNVREVDEAALEQKKIGDEAEDAYENMSDAVDHAISNEGQLVAEEDRRVGRVTRDVYKAYVKAGGGYLSLFGVLLLFTLAQVVRQVAEVWLGRWSTASDSLDDPSDEADLFQENRTNALIFLGLTLGTVFFTLLRAAFFADRTMAASQGLHDQLLKRVLHATPSFFDSNPIGRILNRFSKDIDQMDVMLPITAQDFLQIAFVALGALATIAWILPWFLIPLVPIVAGFIHLQRMYKKSSRELKRIDGISRSPIYAHFVETATGLATVRAYSAEANFTQHFHNQIDLNHAAYHMFACAGRWLGVRLDALAGMVVFFTSLTVLLMAQNVLDPGLAGVALTQSILMTGVFQWGVRQAAETENLFTSVERVSTMATEAPVEKPYEILEARPPQSWPSEGVVSFENVVLKYRPELDPALEDLTFKTRPRERVGIVGRTGSGKSSLFVSLFRMVELTSGQITVDGVDISKLGLHDLRSKLAIVPQDPVLFNGTIRSNLDPPGKHDDAVLWDALHRVHMGSAIQGISGSIGEGGHGLDLVVNEKGNNFSAGERQLLSLARAILSGVKVVVLDEASASLDNHTDMLIQKTVREQLSDRTVLTIAHRLATIADSDRVLVIDAGEVVEFDTPRSLMERGGYFARLVDETGSIESAILKAMIAEASGPHMKDKSLKSDATGCDPET